MTSVATQHNHLFIGYWITLGVALLCNFIIVYCIATRPMKSPNIRYILLLTVCLILGEIFGLPYAYSYNEDLCIAAGSLKAYFEVMVICCNFCMCMLAYLQIFG